jgi:hypothetical protein
VPIPETPGDDLTVSYEVVLRAAGRHNAASRTGVFRMAAEGDPGEAALELGDGRLMPVAFLMPHTLDTTAGVLGDVNGRPVVHVGDRVQVGGGSGMGTGVFLAASVAVLRPGDERE